MNVKALIDDYAAGSALMRKAVAGLTTEQIDSHPVAGKWSVREVVCHIADFEPVYVDRIKRVIAEDRPTLLGADETKFAQHLAYGSRDVEEELQIIELSRRHLTRILRTLPESAFARVGVHNEAGPLTLELLIQRVTKHIPHHVKFIEEKRKVMGVV